MSASKDWPQVTSRNHPAELCVPCFICGKKQPRYSHFSNLSEEQQGFFYSHFSDEVPGRGCLCRAHVREVQKHLCDEKYVPAWRKVGGKGEGGSRVDLADTTIKCMYHQVYVPRV